MRALARVATIDILEPGTPPPKAATALLGDLEILVPLEGIIDKDAEIDRLERQLDKLGKNLGRSRAKLENPVVPRSGAGRGGGEGTPAGGGDRISIGKLEAQLEMLRAL